MKRSTIDRRYRRTHYQAIRVRRKTHRVDRKKLLARKERYRIKNREAIRAADRERRERYRNDHPIKNREEKRQYRERNRGAIRRRDRRALARNISPTPARSTAEGPRLQQGPVGARGARLLPRRSQVHHLVQERSRVARRVEPSRWWNSFAVMWFNLARAVHGAAHPGCRVKRSRMFGYDEDPRLGERVGADLRHRCALVGLS